ncbi:hypothetical protein HF086_017674 [Spodoptera exigua]|uniref:Peptidase S1 domain-containing protein n=1 Tax=Spodoptera exigua TaxID=7107 RepID=A0A922MHC0_SPOEX|nr:hypothetical protein HF086_017674 [Spodoptera exigua]
MFAIKLDLVLFFVLFLETNCQRRIHEGKNVTKDKPYVVYLVKAPIASVRYDYWLCGGALVTSEYVVTSAACIKDVDYLYVIAGYNKYVTDVDLEKDKCTSKMKKKVIYTCYPEGYEIRYERLDKWALIDIGVVKVESPYDFTDQSYKTICSYTPSVIPVSYEARYQEPGTDAIVFGWGHLLKWRKRCLEDQSRRFIGAASLPLNESGTEIQNETFSLPKNALNETSFFNESVIRKRPLVYNVNGRRHGICQNDHGGPLVTWVGTHEILIGIASVFKVSEDSECIGPFLYTSTQCNGAFLDCILTTDKLIVSKKKQKDKTRRAVCRKRPGDEGHPTVERHISWLHHPAGAAENEKIGRNGHIVTSDPEEDEKAPNIDFNPEVHIRNISQDFLNVNKPIPNNQFEGNERFSVVNSYGNRNQYVPNLYEVNEQYSHSQQFGTDHYIPANVPNNNIPASWVTQNGNKLAQRPVPIGRYDTNVMSPPIIRTPVQISVPVVNYDRQSEIYKPAPFKITDKVLNGGNEEFFRMRPQIPLHV